jgi:disulfide bond formation protein DsbB
MLYADQKPASSPAYRIGAGVLIIATGALLMALGSEHLGGLKPCPLCYQQRYAYYAAIPLLFAALVMVAAESRRMAAVLFGLVALAFLANAGLASYHAGVEWGYWPGPQGCAGEGGPAASVGDLLSGLESETGVRCDQPALVVLGLSMAGWNALTSLALALGAAKAAMLAMRTS